MKKIINILNKIILIILICILLFICFEKFIRKEKLIKLGKYAILIVLSESMEPTIGKDEMIVIKESDNYDLKDIITYQDDEGYLITHRIMQIDEYTFISKGDNNYVSDNNQKVENIKGKVIYHSKMFGNFLLYFLKPIILIYIGILVVIYMIQMFKEVEKNENKKE